MAPISDELRAALGELDVQIKNAERFLHKHPGASKASVDVTYCFDEEADDLCLEAARDEDNETRIYVRRYNRNAELLDAKLLVDYHTALRIELCASIGDLLESAVKSESAVAESARQAAQSIEQLLAEYQEG